jgi:two-component system, OmpR family, KDP operon response regulator KdpE
MITPSTVPVLIVDDDDGIRVTLYEILRDEGYVVHEAASVGEALARFCGAEAGFVVLLDYMLPGDDGMTLLRMAERDARLGRHRYVFLSAVETTRFTDDERRLIAAQCTRILPKPFDLDALLDAVSAAAAQIQPPHSEAVAEA